MPPPRRWLDAALYRRAFFPIILLTVSATPAQGSDAPLLFQKHCASCHGPDRLGATGPSLLPETLSRLKPEEAATVIRDGRPATQMPAFKDVLSAGEITALAELAFTPLPAVPVWGEREIHASRIVIYKEEELPATPQYDADPLNLFLVVEAGDHHVTVLDGDRFEPIHRFPSRYALHGGPKYSPDGRFVFLASRDGWVTKFDMYNLKVVAEVRAGINTRNLAVSADGRFVAVGNYLPQNLVILDAAGLLPVRVIPVRDDNGHVSRVSAVYDAPPRQSFIAALKDIKEVWEISYADNPPYYGRVHDYRDEGPPLITERFPVRRIALDNYLDDFFFDADYQHLIGAARDGNNGQVINLLVGRKIADIAIKGMPHLGSGITWDYLGRPVLATPNLQEGGVTVIDMETWKTIKTIKTEGPGFFLRSHERTPYAWADVFFGPNKDAVHVIDKNTLEIVKTLRPSPGRTSAHVEFTRDGRYALLSIWEMDGAVIIYDALTLEEVKRIPMKKPSGKYNVYNKIHYSMGTSH